MGMRGCARFLAVLAVLLVADGQSSEFDTDVEKALAPVKAFIAEGVELSGRQKIMLQTVINGSLRDAEVVAADKQMLKLMLNKDVVEYPWQKISSRNIYALGRACVQGNFKRAIQLAEYARVAGLRDKADDALALAKEISRQPAGPSAPNNEQIKALKNAVESATLAETSPEGAPIVVPEKLAFRASSPGMLTPAPEVAAALDNVIEIDLAEMSMKPEPVTDDFTFLRRASLDLMKDPRYRHPYYWAAFQVIGAGG